MSLCNGFLCFAGVFTLATFSPVLVRSMAFCDGMPIFSILLHFYNYFTFLLSKKGEKGTPAASSHRGIVAIVAIVAIVIVAGIVAIVVSR